MSMVASPRPSRESRRNRRQEPRRHLKVVDPPVQRGRRRLFLFLAFVAVFMILFVTVTFHVRLVSGQQRIDRLNHRAEVAQKKYNRLRVDVDRLSAPSRIVSRARSLGMVESQDPTWLAPGAATSGGDAANGDPTLRDYLDVKPYLQDTK